MKIRSYVYKDGSKHVYVFTYGWHKYMHICTTDLINTSSGRKILQPAVWEKEQCDSPFGCPCPPGPGEPAEVLLAEGPCPGCFLSCGPQEAEKMHEKDKLCFLIEGLGGIERIETLQLHVNQHVAQTALSLIEKHFGEVSDCRADRRVPPSWDITQ